MNYLLLVIYVFIFLSHLVLKMARGSQRQLSTEAIESFKHLKIIEVKPFVYNVQMNREKKLNALNKQLWS